MTDDFLVFLDVNSKIHLKLDNPSLIAFLDLLRKSHDKDSIINDIKKRFDLSSLEAKKMFELLVDKNVIVKKNKDLLKTISTKKLWFKYGWESAYYFHTYTKDYPFIDYSSAKGSIKDYRLMKNYIKNSSPPPIYKSYKTKKFDLLKHTTEEIENLKFVRPLEHIKNVSLSLEKLSLLLFLSFGKISTFKMDILGESLHKTSPSGGARHPSECYVFIFSAIDKITPGVYHYLVKDHSLSLVDKKDYSGEIKEIFYQTNHFRPNKFKAIITITSLFERSMWRYREPRSFRASVFDIGHLIATIRVASQSLGLNIIIGDGLDEERIRRILKIEGLEEEPFSFIAIK